MPDMTPSAENDAPVVEYAIRQADGQIEPTMSEEMGRLHVEQDPRRVLMRRTVTPWERVTPPGSPKPCEHGVFGSHWVGADGTTPGYECPIPPEETVTHEQRDGVCVGCEQFGEPVEWLLAEARGHSDERQNKPLNIEFPPQY